jgi:hypothetical protein
MDNVQEHNICSYKNIFSIKNKTVRMLQRSFNLKYLIYESRDSEVVIATGYELDGRGLGVPSPSRCETFLFFIWSRPLLRPTKTPIQCLSRALSPGVKLTTNLQLVPISRIHVYTSSSPYTSMAYFPISYVQEHLFLYSYTTYLGVGVYNFSWYEI